MVEANEELYTSFEPSTFKAGGAGWADTEVLVTGARFITENWAKQDGTIPKDSSTGEPMKPKTMFELKGIAQVEGEPKERREIYSVGNGWEPTADGMGLAKAGTITKADPWGQPGQLHENCAMAKWLAALYNTGFPFATLRTKDGKPFIAGLVGAVLLMKGENKLDKDGKKKVHTSDGKTYEDFAFYPGSYMKEKSAQGGGQAAKPVVAGVKAATTVATANSAAVTAKPGERSATEQEAIDALLGVLADKGGSVTRGELVKLVPGLSQQAKLLLVKVDFLKGIEGVAFDGATLSLS